MTFSQKRGRPRKNSPKIDYGTKELLRKKDICNNLETLDLLLKYEIIPIEEYDAGMHFRWLYTIIFGSPKITAYNLKKEYKQSAAIKSEEWLAQKHKEYYKCIRIFEQYDCKKMAINFCIFDIKPSFLINITNRHKKIQKLINYNSEVIKLRNAFKMIIKDPCITKRSYSNKLSFYKIN